MPIYEYMCTQCNYNEDILQKHSDQPLTQCPKCNQESFIKRISAPSFHLKGTGWYVTDFRDNDKKPKTDVPSATESTTTESAAVNTKETPTTQTTES
jgi:putative FmdB family regulatory protein